MDIFKNLFSNHLKLVPLQKRGNISNEVIEQSEKLTIEKGYGSILIEELISIAESNNINRINGWISKEDVGHLEKLKYFYQKNGFYVNIYPRYDEVNSNQIGEISWVKES